MQLILASSSKYRQQQLAKLGLDFISISPDIDETANLNETPDALAIRLASSKAKHILAQNMDALVIGSDQVAFCNGKIIGKPGSYANAYNQLQSFSQQVVIFYTAVCICSANKSLQQTIITKCKFIKLSNSQIEQYLKIDSPFDTAGSAKIEELGIALMESVQSDDPSALIGLPLIAVCKMLRQFGIDPLGQ